MILENYLWQAPEFFSKEEINQLNQAASSIRETTGQIGVGINADKDSEVRHDMGTEDWSIRSSTIKWFEPQYMPENLSQKIYDAANMANEQCGWNHTWEYMENPQYTIYNAQPERQGDFYTWHTDAGPVNYPNGTHRKLSMTIQLSDQDDYEGGHFQWLEPAQQFDKMNGTNPQVNMQDAIRTLSFSSKTIGSVCVFPSFLYHQVTPVLVGQRKSLVCWFAGKPYV
jgi:PKHD-type hydroxylase